MGLRTVTVDRPKKKPLILTVSDDPEDVTEVLASRKGTRVIFRDKVSGYFLGTNGKYVKNRGHSTRYNPDEARKKLEAQRNRVSMTHWEAT